MIVSRRSNPTRRIASLNELSAVDGNPLKIAVWKVAVVDGTNREWQSSLEQACDQPSIPVLEVPRRIR